MSEKVQMIVMISSVGAFILLAILITMLNRVSANVQQVAMISTKKLDMIHGLVSSHMRAALRVNKITTKRLAEYTQNKKWEEAAKVADDAFAKHCSSTDKIEEGVPRGDI